MVDWQQLFSIAPFAWKAIGTAMLCSTIIGMERQLNGKPIGIRTSSLIVLGTYIFMAAAIYVSNDMSDPSRIIGQVITGIGFLGAGVMLARDGLVLGVTSAATIWSLASIGVCIGIGFYLSAIKLSVVVVSVLVGVDWLEGRSLALGRGAHQRYHHWRDRSTDIEHDELDAHLMNQSAPGKRHFHKELE